MLLYVTIILLQCITLLSANDSIYHTLYSISDHSYDINSLKQRINPNINLLQAHTAILNEYHDNGYKIIIWDIFISGNVLIIIFPRYSCEGSINTYLGARINCSNIFLQLPQFFDKKIFLSEKYTETFVLLMTGQLSSRMMLLLEL